MIYFKFPWKRVAITQYYSSKHQAIDNSSKGNIYNYLPCDAKIVKNQWYDDYGWMVEYEAKDERGTFIMANGHMKSQSTLKVGTTYKMGTKIGTIGTTGKSTGPHDHFRISLNGKRKNPLDYLYLYEDQEVHPEDAKLVKYFKDVAKTYTIIVDKIPVYTNSTNAKNGKNSTGTWSKGTYYVFNEAYGMINITTKIGSAGAWINPKDNIVKETPITPPKEEETPIEEEKPIETPPIENTEKEPNIGEEEQPSDNNTTEEEKPQETPSNEEIEGNTPIEEPKINIFAQIIKIVIDFIIKLFRK